MHQTLGHASLSTLQHISFLKPLCTDAIIHKIKSCESCHKAKQQRLPFVPTSIQTNDIFELIHVDIWGPCKETSLTNTPFLLTVVDDYSGYLDIFNNTQKSSSKIP